MKPHYLLSFLALAGATAPPLAVAQSAASGPWAVVPTTPPFCNCGFNFTTTHRLQLAAGGTVWATRYNSGGMGAFTSTIMGSADDGQTWQTRAYSGSYNNNNAYGGEVRDLSALDGQRAWAVLYQYPSHATQVLQTTAGAAAFAVAPAQPVGEVFFLRFFNASTGIAIVKLDASATGWPVQRTSDGGLTWVPITTLPPATAGTLPLAVTQLGSHLWATMGQGKVLHTPDAGQTWTVSSAAQDLTQLTFRDPQNGLATGTGNSHPLFRTSDGGVTWNPLTATGARRMTALAAVTGSAGTYLSVGQTSTLNGDQAGTAVSYNDGQTWQDLGGTDWLDGLAVDPVGRAWASFYGTGALGRFAGSPLASRPARPAQLALFPNPTTGTVALPSAGGFREVQVYDVAGRLCLTLPLGQEATTLDLANLQPGLYVVRLLGGIAGLVQQQLVVAR